MIDLITGHQGVPHISAEQVSTIQNALMYGYGQDQIVRIKDGGISKDGLEILIAAGYWRANGHDIQITEDDSVILDPTSEDMSRIDVVYAELLQDIPSGVQRVELVVVQGTESETPTEPPVPVAPQLTTDLLLLAVPVVKATVTEGAMTIVDQTLPLTGGSGSSAMYGECNTSSSVSTKVVTTEGGDFALEAGNHVFVKFSNGNTVTSPTLQVDDCPAKTIVGYVLVRPEIWWKGYEVVEFVYDGSYFIMLPTSGQIETLLHGLTNYVIYGSTNDTGSTILEGQFFYKGNILARAKSQILTNESLINGTNYEPVLWGGLNELSMQLYNETRTISRYGSCSTGASSTAKTVSTGTGDFSLRSGNRIYVKFTYTNTATSPTLNVDSTGAKSIKGYNSTKPDIWWNAGDVVEFVYDGTNYIMMPTQGQISTLNKALTDANVQITALKASTDVSSGFYFDTSAVKNAHVDAARNGNVITVYGYYTPISNIPSNTPFLFSGTYDMAKPVLGNDSGGIDYVSPLSHKIDVRPSGQRTANAQYYFSFTFITTTPLS